MQTSHTITARDDVDILSIDNQYASARIALFGAHVISFVPKKDGRERLWLSDCARFDGKTAIRGGIPVCWPWFAAHPDNPDLPSHGFLRNQQWHVDSISETAESTTVRLLPGDVNGPGFHHAVEVTLVVDIGKQLTVSLITHNRDNEAILIGGALHSYLAINDIDSVTIDGIEGPYSDKVSGLVQQDSPRPYQISGEVDRIHTSPVPAVTVTSAGEITHLHQSGHNSVVVWNPWVEKSRTMTDMPDDGYRQMLCVEAAIAPMLSLPAGENLVLSQRIG
ncbi:D-hexose-6-phosphate mutarotase [Aestuariibacter halophilus]|uniref:Putative glucose-6-phosphate 1-epimerase n=1 Tax=Fluctibacter halophilus TaxID=226011 RepID=A0ABS8G870_9ALTE|nr:D-hexose-6-phosphate mutarotase [Aestuariibacter halophilus]MCC2615421.1 D-hexose-6-phosphate mutarotase [Aestuariibacter halophilus]